MRAAPRCRGPIPPPAPDSMDAFLRSGEAPSPEALQEEWRALVARTKVERAEARSRRVIGEWGLVPCFIVVGPGSMILLRPGGCDQVRRG